MKKKKSGTKLLNKIKLWVALHGGLSNISEETVCSVCPHYHPGPAIYCKMYGQLRLVVNKKLDKITYKILHDDDYDWFCAEWVRHV